MVQVLFIMVPPPNSRILWCASGTEERFLPLQLGNCRPETSRGVISFLILDRPPVFIVLFPFPRPNRVCSNSGPSILISTLFSHATPFLKQFSATIAFFPKVELSPPLINSFFPPCYLAISFTIWPPVISAPCPRTFSATPATLGPPCVRGSAPTTIGHIFFVVLAPIHWGCTLDIKH